MTCRDAEEKIYLYEELPVAERTGIDEHVSTCASCREAMNAYRVQREITGTLAVQVPVIRNAGALTHKIMGALEKRPVSAVSRIQYYLDMLWLKASLMGISALLTVFFMVEQRQPAVLPANHPLMEGPVLDTHAFIKQQQEAIIQQRTSVYERYTQIKKEREKEIL